MDRKTLTPIDPDISLLEAVTYAKDQPEYIPLPVRRSDDGEVVSRWRPNWRARLAVLFGADFYLTMLTFGGPLTPVRVSVEKPVYAMVPEISDPVEDAIRAGKLSVSGASGEDADPAAAPVADATGDPNGLATEPIAADPAAAAEAIDPAAVLDPNAPAVDELSDFEKLFPADDPADAAAAAAAAAVDPNAAAPVVSEAMQKAFAVSEYVKDESQVENAIRAADEVFQVQLGKIPAHQMLEGFRARDPEGFERIVTQSLIPYIEHLTGKKLGGAPGEAPDPLATMQAEIDRLKGEPQRAEERRLAIEHHNQADTATRSHVETLIKASAGIFDGATDDAINAMAAQLPKLGIDPNKLMADVRAGKTADLDRAFKAADKAAMLAVKAQGTRLIARSKALKGALPPGKGNPASAAAVDELPADATREQMVAYLKG